MSAGFKFIGRYKIKLSIYENKVVYDTIYNINLKKCKTMLHSFLKDQFEMFLPLLRKTVII